MVSEIALSFILLVGAGLLIKSFMRLRDVSPGFNPNNVLTMRLSLPGAKYAQGEPRAQIFRQATERLKSLPGVQSAGAVLSLPLGGDTFNVGRAYIREGRPATPEESANAAYLVATPDYFRTLQIPLVSGRAFNDQDTEQTPKVVIVNETMARQLWPGESPVGKRITIWRDEKFPPRDRGRGRRHKTVAGHASRIADVCALCTGFKLDRHVARHTHQWRTDKPDRSSTK